MSLTPWIAFVTACDQGTLGAAAHELGYTQSAVSRQIASLEQELGAALLERRPRGVRPTSAGAAVLVHARLLVAEAERARRAAHQPRAGRHVAVGAVPSMAIALLPGALRASDQLVSWTLVTDLTLSLVARVAAHELDLAVVTDAPPGLPTTTGVSFTHLLDDPMAVLLPADTDPPGIVRLEDLRDEVWLEDNAGSRTLLQQTAARHGVTLDIELVGGDLMTKVALVAAGHGVALLPSSLASALRPDVRIVRLDDAPVRGIYAVTNMGVDAADDVLESLRAAARFIVPPAGPGDH
ncbi:MAG TPA: LysR family transcriptional regulator [Intrasporangium sp.]|nr:LysR family transcriptional regulator [Intrasporangium sp.]